jgi:DNA-binding LytR/AlgR family response regulator
LILARTLFGKSKTPDVMQTSRFIPIGGGQRVKPEDVILLQADVNYTIIHFSDGKKAMVATTLKRLEQRFMPYAFYRIHKSYVVNLHQIKNFTEMPSNVELLNDQMVSVSRRRKEGLKKWLINH